MAKILVVDDRVTNREFLVTLLGYYNHEVVIAEDGGQALKVTKAEHPDLIITDILMPVMDGYELALQLREDPELKHIPIIFYSATFRLEDAALIALKSGVKYILSKPSEPQKIIDMVNDALHATEPQAPTDKTSSKKSKTETSPEPQDFTLEVETVRNVKNALIAHTQEVINSRERLIAATQKFPPKLSPLTNIRSRLSALVELHMDLELEHDPIKLLSLFGAAAIKIMNAKSAVLGILNSDQSEFDYYFLFNQHSVSIENSNQPDTSQGIIKEILAKHEPLLINELTPAKQRLLTYPAINKNFLGTRIDTGHKLIGIIYFGDKVDNPPFNEVDVELISALAEQFAILYIENQKSYINTKNLVKETD